ncbi:MAG: hypothetical protein ACI8S6_002482 [Myxococcota bacterium]
MARAALRPSPHLDCCPSASTTTEHVLLYGPHDGLSVLRCRCGACWLARMLEATHWRSGAEDELDMWYSPLTAAEAKRLSSGADRSLDFLSARPSILVDRHTIARRMPDAPTKPTP